MVVLDISDGDYVHEEEIIRNPHNVKTWLRYAEHKADSNPNELNMVYERALKQLPGSYKLWYKYLRLRRKQCKGKNKLRSKLNITVVSVYKDTLYKDNLGENMVKTYAF